MIAPHVKVVTCSVGLRATQSEFFLTDQFAVLHFLKGLSTSKERKLKQDLSVVNLTHNFLNSPLPKRANEKKFGANKQFSKSFKNSGSVIFNNRNMSLLNLAIAAPATQNFKSKRVESLANVMLSTESEKSTNSELDREEWSMVRVEEEDDD